MSVRHCLIIQRATALANSVLERKIRLLSLASLGARNIGKDLPYSTVASALEVDENKVEIWVIDGEFGDLHWLLLTYLQSFERVFSRAACRSQRKPCR